MRCISEAGVILGQVSSGAADSAIGCNYDSGGILQALALEKLVIGFALKAAAAAVVGGGEAAGIGQDADSGVGAEIVACHAGDAEIGGGVEGEAVERPSTVAHAGPVSEVAPKSAGEAVSGWVYVDAVGRERPAGILPQIKSGEAVDASPLRVVGLAVRY